MEHLWNPDVSSKLLMSKERLSGADLNTYVPSRTALDMSVYRFVDSTQGLVQNDAVEIARGCPFSCVFCTSRETTVAARSIDSVFEEIHESIKRNGTKLIMFFDDTFTINKKRAMELFDRIIHAKRTGILDQDLRMYGFTRANTLHDRDLVDSMKEAGCDKITMGIETGNAEILRDMQKGTTLDDYRIAYEMLESVGMTKRGSIIIGHPFETVETIRDSINFVLELDLDEVGVNIMTPYPGQKTFRDAFHERGIRFCHPIHYRELREPGQDEGWRDFGSVNWHDYWRDHLRWGRAVVETETLSKEALIYWHGRFLQEVYGSEQMATRRQRFIDAGNDDEYWHRPWRVNARRNTERIEKENREGMPEFPEPLYKRYTYEPLPLSDYQKNELIMSENRRRSLQKREDIPDHVFAQT